MDLGGFRSEWAARPLTIRLFVAGSFLGFVFSAFRDPSAFGFPAILYSAVFLGLLWKLWEGERAMWWLFVILSAAGVAASVTAAVSGEPAAWTGGAAGALALMLLLAGSTRSWLDAQAASMPERERVEPGA